MRTSLSALVRRILLLACMAAWMASPARGEESCPLFFGAKSVRPAGPDNPRANWIKQEWDEVAQKHAAGGGMDAAMRFLPAPVARQWQTLKDKYPAMSLEERLRAVNGFFNRQLAGRLDASNYDTPEYWAAPLEFLQKGGGDCEDYALAKYYALRHFGWPDEELWLVLLKDASRGPNHAVLAARSHGRVFILDNLSSPGYLIMPQESYARMYIPFYAVQAGRVCVFPAAGDGDR